MTPLPKFTISELELDRLQDYEGQIVLLVQEDGRMDVVGRRINKATKGALARFLESKASVQWPLLQYNRACPTYYRRAS